MTGDRADKQDCQFIGVVIEPFRQFMAGRGNPKSPRPGSRAMLSCPAITSMNGLDQPVDNPAFSVTAPSKRVVHDRRRRARSRHPTRKRAFDREVNLTHHANRAGQALTCECGRRSRVQGRAGSTRVPARPPLLGRVDHRGGGRVLPNRCVTPDPHPVRLETNEHSRADVAGRSR
jgi:hypothetical protein